jgi:DNA-binding MarR family transcriptional regulator
MAKGKRKQSGGAKKPLDGSPSHLMHRVLQVALDIYAEEMGPGAPTQRQFAVLAAVADNEGLTQTDLVHATGIDRSTLADLVARMMGKDLLARERSATDGRANTVRLSVKGRAALEAARPRVESADKRILALLPGGKRNALMKVLGDLAHAGETAKEESGDKTAKKAAKAARKADREAAKAARKARKESARAAKPAKAPKADKISKAPTVPQVMKAPKSMRPGKTPKAIKAVVQKTAKAVKPAKTGVAPKAAPAKKANPAS